MVTLGVAKFGFPKKPTEELYADISELLYDSDESAKVRANTDKIRRLLEFEELRGDKELTYLINYTIKYGHLHLVNPHHRISYRQIYDLDIKFVLAVLVFGFSYFMDEYVFASKPKKKKSTTKK